jgi:hypothetical protein
MSNDKKHPSKVERFTLWTKFLALDRTFPWSFLGWLFGVLGIGLAVYFGFYYSKTPSLIFDVLSNTTIADLSEDQGKLDILYNGKSIKSAGNALSVIILRIENNGTAALRPDSFTPDAPLGFVITEGEMIEAPQVIGGSSEYLKQNLKPSLYDKQTAYLKPVIIQAGESATLKALVIHQVNPKSPLDIKPIGVVADVTAIPVKHSYDTESEQSTWNKATSGVPLVQFHRLLLYGCIYALITVLLYAVYYWRGKRFARKTSEHRRLIASRFVASGNPPPTVFARMLRLYEGYGLEPLQLAHDGLRHFVEDKTLSPFDCSELVFASIIEVDPLAKTSSIIDPLSVFKLYSEFLAFVARK